MDLSIEELCKATHGQCLSNLSTSPVSQKNDFNGVSIDSREKDLSGKIFFAIKGEQFDGHHFISEAVQKQAGALVIHSATKFQKNKQVVTIPVIQVPDTAKALQKLSTYWQKKNNLKVIGITGSTGKTTTKCFCLKLMEQELSVLASPKSYNNIYGVSLTVLSVGAVSSDTTTPGKRPDYIIQEMGMNHPGEIKALCQIAPPCISAIVNVGSSHIGFMGDVKNIAKEKEQIYKNSTAEAVHIYNLDNPYTKFMYDSHTNSQKKTLTFSSHDKNADVFLQIDQCTADSLKVSGHFQGVSGSAQVLVSGAAHLNNLMCAVAVALAAGLSPDRLWSYLPLCRLPGGRNQWVDLSSGAKVLFDAYNASPESTIALMEHFLSQVVKGEKALILGDFMELGSYLPSFYQTLAQKLTVAQKDLSLICFIGEQGEMFKEALSRSGCQTELILSSHFDHQLAQKIMSMLNPSSVLAFKASRKIQLEKFLMYFKPINFKNPFV